MKKNGFLETRHGIGFPPQIKSKPIFSRVLRYRCGTAFVDKNMTMASLLNFMVWCQGGNTPDAYPLVDAIKLHRITIYSVPSNNFGGTDNEISLRWSNLGTFENTITDRGTLTEPALIKAFPPKGSLIDMAFDQQNTNLSTTFVNINMPAESIIDFHVSFTLNDGSSTLNTLTANVATPGLRYLAISLGSLIPDGTTGSLVSTST